MDCENDDLSSLQILQTLHKKQNTNMKVYLQLLLELQYNNIALNY